MRRTNIVCFPLECAMKFAGIISKIQLAGDWASNDVYLRASMNFEENGCAELRHQYVPNRVLRTRSFLHWWKAKKTSQNSACRRKRRLHLAGMAANSAIWTGCC